MIPKNSGLVDTYLSYPLANVFVEIFYKLGFTPNLVTTFTLLIRLIVIYNLYYKQNFLLIVLLFGFSWITDCVDGQMARKYNLKSKFGAVYDIIVDQITCLPIILILSKYYTKNRLPYYLFLSFIPILLTIKTIKTNYTDQTSLKIWEKNIFKKLKLDLPTKYKDLFILKLYDESLNYLIMLLFLIYTLYYRYQ